MAKLFNMVCPHKAYFGMKDYQQLKVIEKMVRDLNMPVEIVPCPTVREADGLAKSSRNTYLNPEEREAATVVNRALEMAQERVWAGERDAKALARRVRKLIAAEPLAEIDYVEVVDAESLAPVKRIEGRVLVALAVRFGKTRLIDSAVVGVEEVGQV